MRKYRQTDAIVFYSECRVSSRYRKDTNKRARYTKFALVYFTASARYLLGSHLKDTNILKKTRIFAHI